tara:strand:+ start:137 stop:595 length:459 start_codon:yes stop_codon:yes gene_type:complete
MRNIILFLWLSTSGLVLSQNHISVYNDFLKGADEQYSIDCLDLDETIINILSIFINDPGFGFYGCSDVIPYLESQLFIPLNCNTDLTPFGYFNINVSDVCECSCEEYLSIKETNSINKKLIKTINILGIETTEKGFIIEIYDDGSVIKKIAL